MIYLPKTRSVIPYTETSYTVHLYTLEPYWVAVKEIILSYHNSESVLVPIYAYYHVI